MLSLEENLNQSIIFMTELEVMLNSRPLVPVVYDDKGQ